MPPPAPRAEAYARVAAAVDGIRAELLQLSHDIHANPELAFQEHRAAAWTADLLAGHGFEVTRGTGGLETAFEAKWHGRGDGPVVALLGEYDALPEIGHGCGHNLMCSSSAGAAIAAARALGRDFDGEIRFVGTPAEESGNGKVHLIEAGVLKDVDIAVQVHPASKTLLDAPAQALQEASVVFHGKAAHAAVDPWNGRNALDAMITFFSLLSQWRQHLGPGQMVHGIITHGGAAPNIIPDMTAASFFLRSHVDADIDVLVERFDALANAAAAGAGCTAETAHARTGRTRTMLTNGVLTALFREHLGAAGWVEDIEEGPRRGGSTDMGDVSHELPTIHPRMAIAPKGTPAHSREFAAWTGGPEGDRMCLDAAVMLGKTAVDALLDPSLVEEAWREFRAAKAAGAG